MTKSIKILTILLAVILWSSFTDKNANLFIGTYGSSSSDPAQIKLTINPDHTFYYQDFSVSGNKIVVKGKWSLIGKKVLLSNNGNKTRFHNIWSFVNEGQVAKSRKGFTFYRLCRINGI
jgi:hypothetical protein